LFFLQGGDSYGILSIAFNSGSTIAVGSLAKPACRA
jgi:hypothetical protein